MLRRCLLVLSLAVAGPLTAQTTIVVSGSGRVEVSPDYATVSLGVTNQSPEPQTAADALETQLDGLITALEELGFDVDSLQAKSFSVAPVRNTFEGGTITGYSASASVTLQIPDLERLPEIVERALSAGATNVSRVQFQTTQTEALREEALRRAMEAAENDARIIAEARGMTLGTLIEVTTRPSSGGGILLRGPSTVPGLSAVLSPEMIAITANVGMTWQLGGDPE